MMQTKKRILYYGIWTVILFITEVLIGTWLNDWYFVRAYVGDVLVIPLIYCIIRMITPKLQGFMPFLVCCIGFLAETMQYFHLSDRLGFERGSLPAILIGTSFSWWDILSYIVGMGLIYLAMLLRHTISANKRVN